VFFSLGTSGSVTIAAGSAEREGGAVEALAGRRRRRRKEGDRSGVRMGLGYQRDSGFRV